VLVFEHRQIDNRANKKAIAMEAASKAPPKSVGLRLWRFILAAATSKSQKPPTAKCIINHLDMGPHQLQRNSQSGQNQIQSVALFEQFVSEKRIRGISAREINFELWP
jgi:hypothetical protein